MISHIYVGTLKNSTLLISYGSPDQKLGVSLELLEPDNCTLLTVGPTVHKRGAFIFLSMPVVAEPLNIFVVQKRMVMSLSFG